MWLGSINLFPNTVHSLFLKREKVASKDWRNNSPIGDIATQVADDVIAVWDKTDIPHYGRKTVKEKIEKLLVKSKEILKIPHERRNNIQLSITIFPKCIIHGKIREKGGKCRVLGCDGTSVNTGIHSGSLRGIQIDLSTEAHQFVCLLHLNELFLRHRQLNKY